MKSYDKPVLSSEYLDFLFYLYNCAEGSIDRPVNACLPLGPESLSAAQVAAVYMGGFPDILRSEDRLHLVINDLLYKGFLQPGRPIWDATLDLNKILYPNLGFPLYISQLTVDLVKRVFKTNERTAVPKQPESTKEKERKLDNGHFAYPTEKRREIVQHYRQEKLNRNISNKDAWARSNHQISGRTLLNYEKEFPET